LCQRLDRFERGNKKAFSTVRIPTVDEERERTMSRQEAQPSLFGSACSIEECDQQQSQSNIVTRHRKDAPPQAELDQLPSTEKSNRAAYPAPHALTVYQTEGDKKR
jgi:hypothetical protein